MNVQKYEEGDNRMSLGQTHLTGQNLILPRVKITQQMSQEVVDKQVDAGEFYNTLTSESFGAELRFIPLFPFMQRVFIVRPERKDKADEKLLAADLPALPDGDGLMCRSLDMFVGIGDPGVECNTCPLSKWVGRTEAPMCSETYNVAALTERGELIIMSFARSSAKAGRKMFSIMRFQPEGTKPWARIWQAKTRLEKNDRGAFYVPDIALTPDQTPPELMGEAMAWARQFEGAPIDVTPQAAEDIVEQEGGATAPADLPF